MNDRYTKAVLTVIAGALVAIVAQNMVGPVGAQNVQRVVLCDAQNISHCASVYGRNWGLSTQQGFLAVSQGLQ